MKIRKDVTSACPFPTSPYLFPFLFVLFFLCRDQQQGRGSMVGSTGQGQGQGQGQYNPYMHHAPGGGGGGGGGGGSGVPQGSGQGPAPGRGSGTGHFNPLVERRSGDRSMIYTNNTKK